MLGRLLVKSLWKQKSRTSLILLSVATAAALVTAFLNIAFTITEEMAMELRSFGANILLVPKTEPLEIEIGGMKYVSPEEAAYLGESDLPKLKTIFCSIACSGNYNKDIVYFSLNKIKSH